MVVVVDGGVGGGVGEGGELQLEGKFEIKAGHFKANLTLLIK